MLNQACHLKELFIRENGDIFPCCRSAYSDNMKIGHIDDKNLLEKLISYNKECNCSQINLVPGTKADMDYAMFNVELSYHCQATCSMCCVDAPGHKIPYNEVYYTKIGELIKELRPKGLWVQGGEILIQEKSMQWLESLKKQNPELSISLITNGNNTKEIERTEKLFDRVWVSIVGFQSETYKNIMGLNIEKTKEFCETLIKSNEVENIGLKYLLTPTNIQDLPLFIDWAMSVNPNIIMIQDSVLEQYIKFTNDEYWEKTFLRTQKEFTKVIKKRITQEHVSNYKFKIKFYNNSLNYFKLDDEYIKSNAFEKIVTLIKNDANITETKPLSRFPKKKFISKLKLLCKSLF